MKREKRASYDLLNADSCDPCRIIFEKQESVGQLREARGRQRQRCPGRGAQPGGLLQFVALPLQVSEDC